jgi:divalent metal cation (Fe/Co/Zn/Cd) transporter
VNDIFHFLMALAVFALVAGIGWWAFKTILANVPLPQPVRAILVVVAVLFICAFLFKALGLWHLPAFR